MGTKMVSSYANIFMHYLEQKFLDLEPIKPFLCKRYIDAIFAVWTASETQLDVFLKKLNTFHKTIKFTWEINNTSVNFLDITIYKGTRFATLNKLDYKTYFKPTNTFQYLRHHSSHTKATKNTVIIRETKRFQRTNSDTENYSHTITQLKYHLSL